jgi:aryl-alcohol dehydrogenase-like predicted oxidoreductase
MTGVVPVAGSVLANLIKIGLGTAQFGNRYGISNSSGQVLPDEVARILSLAARLGIRWLDTAPGYGNSEAVLGEMIGVRSPFQIVTKTLPMDSGGVNSVMERVRESSRLLRRKPLDALLVHAAMDLWKADGPALWEAMQALKRSGDVRKIGISAYFDEAPLELARRYSPDLMQMPISMLDQRLIRSGDLARIRNLGIEIHARSIFTQGLLFLEPSELPPKLVHGAGRLREVKRALNASGLSPIQAALQFGLEQPDVDVIIVGVASMRELAEVATAAQARRADGLDWGTLAVYDSLILDPRAW